MFIIGGTSSQSISKGISSYLKIPLAKSISYRFPDGEFYVKILDKIKGEDVILIQTTYPDPKIVELLIIKDALIEAGAKRIALVIPYFGYSRQDKKFGDGEPISARAMAKHTSTDTEIVLTVDPHKEHILNFFTTNACSCNATTDIANYLKNKDVDFVLAPDKGAKDRVEKTSKIIGCEYDYMEKTRIDGETIKIKPKNLDAKNKKVAIIDDIISTGGTMAKSIEQLKNQGAKQVLVACTHGLFACNSIEKLKKAGCDEIISTNTIENKFNKVDVSPCISNKLKKHFIDNKGI